MAMKIRQILLSFIGFPYGMNKIGHLTHLDIKSGNSIILASGMDVYLPCPGKANR